MGAPQGHHPRQQPALTTAYLEIEAWLLQESWARSGYYSRDIICNRKRRKRAEEREGEREGGEGKEGGGDKRSKEGRNARGKGEGG